MTMFCLRGDTVRTKSGVIGQVVDVWGVARTWVKIKTDDGQTLYLMTDQVDSIIQRDRGRKTKWQSRSISSKSRT